METLKEILASNVKAIREGKDLKQADLADRAGLARQVIVQIEGAQVWPQYPTIQALAGALEVKETQLIAPPSVDTISILEKLNDLRDSVKVLMDERHKRLSPEQAELVKIIGGLNINEVRVLLRQARHFADKVKMPAVSRKSR